MSALIKAKRINVGIMGHVDSGKSTLTGHLIYLTKQITEHEYKKLTAEAIKLNNQTFKFAFVTDKTQQQRKRGITIQPTLLEFKSPNRVFTIVDLPGHALFSKNFVNAATQINLAVLLVSADDGIMPQTIEHARIAIANGVKRMIVVINKMDKPGVDYSQARFNEIKSKLQTALSKYLTYLHFIPISAIAGQNIVEISSNLSWYHGQPLLALLDSQPYPQIDESKPFRLQVTEVYNKTGIGVVAVGNVICGAMRPNQVVMVKPSNKKGEIKSIEIFHQLQQKVVEGDSVGCTVRGLSKEDVKRGYILAPPEDTPINTVAVDVDLTMAHNTIELRQASDIIMHYGGGNTAARIERIYRVYDANHNIVFDETTGDSKTFKIVRGNSARVKLTPIKTIPMELAQDNPTIGKLSIRNEQGYLACAAVVKIYPHQNENVSSDRLEAATL